MKLWLVNLFLLVALSISVLGDIFAKTWTLNRKLSFVAIAMALYLVATALWVYWLQFNKLSVALAWWQAFGAMLTLFVGIFYFKERLTLWEGAAIFLVIAGLVLLNAQQLFKQGA